MRAWIVDDTGVPEKGRHSVSLSPASEGASPPVAFRLHLPGARASDHERRGRAGLEI